MILSFFTESFVLKKKFSFMSILSAVHKFDKRIDQLNLDDHCVQHQNTILSNSSTSNKNV